MNGLKTLDRGKDDIGLRNLRPVIYACGSHYLFVLGTLSLKSI